MMKGASPLRYPGGKWRWERYFKRIISMNGLSGATYVEGYAGGASLALSLLIGRAVSEIFLNDLDRSVFAFWHCVVKHNQEFIRRVAKTPVTVGEWERQKEVHRQRGKANLFDLGFATFFLNRTNRSGLLNGGIIGGKAQRGEWKIDARFNRDDLIERLRRVGQHSSQIHISGRDALEFIADVVAALPRRTLVYLDPPYYKKGRELYLNAYRTEDHVRIKRAVCRHLKQNWIVSYDDTSPVRELYSSFRSRRATLQYSARAAHAGKEILFFSNGLRLPHSISALTAPA
jgi:DNA adenine methylase